MEKEMTELSTETSGRRSRREGGRRREGEARVANAIPQLPRRRSIRRFPPVEIISSDEVETIHQASLKVLEEIGMDFMLPEARDLLKKAGARVEGERVRFDRQMIEELIRSAPPRFTFHARNPENTREIGGNDMVFGTVGSPPNSSDMDRGRRPGNLADYHNFLRLAQYFNCIGFISGYAVEPIDVHASVRHLVALRDTAI